jgi:hypothetical protein
LWVWRSVGSQSRSRGDGAAGWDLDPGEWRSRRNAVQARPAYEHFLKRQPRRSIETGTTNADTYLPKQTGNRRFWPMKVLAEIDIEKLTRDRLQLWGEAAHWQSKGESLALPREYWADAGVEQDARRVAVVPVTPRSGAPFSDWRARLAGEGRKPPW